MISEDLRKELIELLIKNYDKGKDNRSHEKFAALSKHMGELLKEAVITYKQLEDYNSKEIPIPDWIKSTTMPVWSSDWSIHVQDLKDHIAITITVEK